MYKYLLVGVLMLGNEGCATIEQLQTAMGHTLGTTPGRAFFLRKSISGSEVLVCDVRSSALYCYPSNVSSEVAQ